VDKADVIAHIREAFRQTEHPGDAFLQGSKEGCEPYEATAPFIGITDWAQVDSSVLDANYDALSFFSEGGFRFFLPAYLLADLEGLLQTADPVFHLTHGFSDRTVNLSPGPSVREKLIGKSALMNPRRYGAMTWYDYVRFRLSIFTREEARAISAYLEYKRDTDTDGLATQQIGAALQTFWLDRAAHAPEQISLSHYLAAEEEYLKAIRAKDAGS
jgi:hypothetical protein